VAGSWGPRGRGAELTGPTALSQARRKLLARLATRKSREREGRFLVEGIRSAREALEARAVIELAVISPRALALGGGEQLVADLGRAGVEIVRVADEELDALSDTESPQGVTLVCRERSLSLDQLFAGAGPGTRLLLLDGIQDPGNAGTLVRCADAFAMNGVVALDGTVDLYNPKVVRASAGGVFRVPVVHEPWARTGPWLAEHEIPLLVADAAGDPVPQGPCAPPWALVIGSEADGVRSEIAGAARDRVRIPMPGGSESLNAAVAGAILLYVLTQETKRVG
jgi:TrmH family RNA methyltransferase